MRTTELLWLKAMSSSPVVYSTDCDILFSPMRYSCFMACNCFALFFFACSFTWLFFRLIRREVGDYCWPFAVFTETKDCL